MIKKEDSINSYSFFQSVSYKDYHTSLSTSSDENPIVVSPTTDNINWNLGGLNYII